ncbi:MAG: VOC family protein, partial [Proteobacteria bacterium]|nr:VOC family protein [Pseudomonadota bacterium]
DFYRDIVGLTPVAGGIDKPFVALAGTTGVICLMLWRVAESRPVGFHHFSMEMASEAALRESKARLLAETGVKIVREIEHPGRYALFIEDLDGFELQLYAERDGRAVNLDTLDPDTAFLLG